MREISNQVELLLEQPTINTFYLFSILGDNLTLYYTTYFSDLIVPGLGTFLSANNIADFEPPIMETASNRESYKITFTDPDFNLRATAESEIIGSRVKVYMGLVNTTAGNVGGADTDEPLLNLEDITLGFDGVLDAKEYAIDVLEQSAIFTMECSTPIASLNTTKPYITSRDAVRNLSTGDTSYDQVYEGSATLNLDWGKI
ncbi:MAG: hypothetical protein DRQ62_00050 [Gammaproteobacteria bacterium]|nr:MAG: hypothetical protein DRQ62_00050 [Gammaproteobacteria bacterium]